MTSPRSHLIDPTATCCNHCMSRWVRRAFLCAPVAGTVAHAEMPARLAEYLDLADWTGRIARPDKRGVIVGAAPPLLGKLGVPEDQWHHQATGIEQHYWRAVGAVDVLMERARIMGQYWLKGSGRQSSRRAASMT